eukprot:TRINITY_DN5168_c0_g1_i2.p1 TRINITY_DN5168_c0_g1~~TRINITY_DN5168_c0_g1_i2.p1  ORF type:complete len:304 (+),score=54.80 TRINITY_DN5168_c0_g1_i2:556-1467(+)
MGHSLGGSTAWMLQHLLSINYFPGHKTSANMIRSLTSVSSPLRGTTTVHMMGLKEEGGFRLLSLASLASKGFHIYELMGWKLIWDFQVDHWSKINAKRIFTDGWEGVKMLLIWLITVLVCSPFSEGKDNAPYDLSVESAARINSKIKVNPKTFYRSYTTSMTRRLFWTNWHVPSTINFMPFLLLMSSWIGRYTKKNLEKSVEELGDKIENWFESDGVANTVGQYHPHSCNENYCYHYKDGMPSELKSRKEIEPGKWQVVELNNLSHFCLLPSIRRTPLQQRFFSDYLQFLNQVDGFVENLECK